MIEISCKRGLWFMATKSIRQIADELGVSKQAVFKKIKREPLSTSLQGLMTTVAVSYTHLDVYKRQHKAALPPLWPTDLPAADGG